MNYFEVKITQKFPLADGEEIECLILEKPKSFSSYLPGQFLYIKENAEDKNRAYSLVSATDDNFLKFYIKNYKNNSREIFKVGSTCLISPPQGEFLLPPKPAEFRTILAFATGIGITSIYSIIKDLVQKENRTRFYIFHGVSNDASCYLKSEMKMLMQQFPGRIHLHYIFSKPENNNFYQNISPLYTGRLTRQKLYLLINQVLHTDPQDDESTIFDAVDAALISGHETMVLEMHNALLEFGIPEQSIIVEDHIRVLLARDVKNKSEVEKSTITSLLLRIRNETIRTELHSPYSILDSLLEQNISVPYSCRSGICGNCSCQLLSGTVYSEENEYLTANEEKSGKILVCRAYPISSNIVISFDEQ